MAGTSFPQGRGGSNVAVMAVGTEREGAPVLGSDVCVVHTAEGEDSVQLPVAHVGGSPITVISVPNPDGTPPAAHGHVWPAENGRIQGEGIDESCDLQPMVVTTFIPVSDTDWAVNLSAAPAASGDALAVRTPEMEAEAAKARCIAKADAAAAKAKAEAEAKEKAEADAKARAEAEKDEADAEARYKAGGKKRHAAAAEA
jgi:hypothetical protein